MTREPHRQWSESLGRERKGTPKKMASYGLRNYPKSIFVVIFNWWA
jgi:hypothetical protein